SATLRGTFMTGSGRRSGGQHQQANYCHRAVIYPSRPSRHGSSCPTGAPTPETTTAWLVGLGGSPVSFVVTSPSGPHARTAYGPIAGHVKALYVMQPGEAASQTRTEFRCASVDDTGQQPGGLGLSLRRYVGARVLRAGASLTQSRGLPSKALFGSAYMCWEAPVFIERTSVGLDVHA